MRISINVYAKTVSLVKMFSVLFELSLPEFRCGDTTKVNHPGNNCIPACGKRNVSMYGCTVMWKKFHSCILHTVVHTPQAIHVKLNGYRKQLKSHFSFTQQVCHLSSHFVVFCFTNTSCLLAVS